MSRPSRVRRPTEDAAIRNVMRAERAARTTRHPRPRAQRGGQAPDRELAYQLTAAFARATAPA